MNNLPLDYRDEWLSRQLELVKNRTKVIIVKHDLSSVTDSDLEREFARRFERDAQPYSDAREDYF